jgi:hypothetical protein
MVYRPKTATSWPSPVCKQPTLLPVQRVLPAQGEEFDLSRSQLKILCLLGLLRALITFSKFIYRYPRLYASNRFIMTDILMLLTDCSVNLVNP